MKPIPEGSLVVSCQADAGSPFEDVAFIRAFARAALQGGARGLRLQGTRNVAAVRAVTDLPIIGLVKHDDRGGVYITPTSADARALHEAGADIIAFDATLRERPERVQDLVRTIHDCGRLALADVSTVQEALAALEAGADAVSTTLSGYTPYSPQQNGPDLALVRALADRGVRPYAEGRIRTPYEARAALANGAYAVVVGSALTRPDVATGWFVDALADARAVHRATSG